MFKGYNSHKNSFFVPSFMKKIGLASENRIRRLSPNSDLVTSIIYKKKETQIDDKGKIRISITPDNLSYHIKANSPFVTPKLYKSKITIGTQARIKSRLSGRNLSKFIETKYSSNSIYFPSIFANDPQKIN